MNDMGINFSWGYVGVTVLGAFIGFVVGEVIERAFINAWARRRRELPSKTQKRSVIQPRISQAASNPK